MGSWARYKIAVLAVLAALIGAAAASATTTTYWGFNNLTESNPPLNTQCPMDGSGVACSGFNNWDRSQIQIAGGTGATVQYGFQNCAGCQVFSATATPLGTYTLIRSVYNQNHAQKINVYNRAVCAWAGGGTSSYVQCRAIIF